MWHSICSNNWKQTLKSEIRVYEQCEGESLK